ncbi:hypothetical protein CMV_030189 [Castanea mollissima]|uniref:Reverse transcriptase n=1 Tax=Castanea mollissima TaxID=60419 RepID=A0A8J4VA42_9ROSI|nr:hypothetical protein CMV_030189 [Castanea mollissima]
MLGFLISGKCEEKLWDSMRASRGGLAFSHLFFANDPILFAKGNMKNCTDFREELCKVLGITSTPNLGKYLGFPLKHLGSTSQDFNFVVERVQNKLQG